MAMSAETRSLIEMERLLAEARDRLGARGTFRTRILFDMAMLEVERALRSRTKANWLRPRNGETP